MTKVRVVSTSTIGLPSSTPDDRIDLTPWDLQFLLLGPIQKGLLFPKPISSQEKLLQPNTSLVKHLKISFSRTLEFFPPLAGRLGIMKHDEENSSFFIDCNNVGAEFVHGVAEDLTVSDVVDPLFIPRIVHSFFPLNGYSNYAGTSRPLLAVQVTELVDGFFIGCTMNHVVADGTCFWMFFNSWAEISRGSDKISASPSFQRWAPDGVDFPLVIPLGAEKELMNHHPNFSDLEERWFHFSSEKILSLKEKANSENALHVSISSLQAVLAHLWRAIVRCVAFSDEEEVKIMLLIGARPRLKPTLPEGYFGNAIHPAFVTATVGELLDGGLGYAAGEMNKVIASQSEGVIREFYKSWVEDPKFVKLGVLEDKKKLGISSSPRHNVYGNDFGWGKPIAVRSGSGNKGYGKITVFPGPEQGSIDVEVCLSNPTLSALADDQEFMNVVAILK